MAKEKVESREIKENSKVFHYEILGIVLLIVGMFAIGKLGIIGVYTNLLIKVLFGDWYFLIIILACVYGIRCILVHRRLKISNVRYLGLFLIVLALILLSHFSVHAVIVQYEENSLILTLKLYFSYFRVQDFDSIVGGGVVGATLFYIFLYLFSKVGVIIISMILIFLGIVFMSKKTIKDFIKMIIRWFKALISLFNKIRKKMKSVIGEYSASYEKKKVKYHIKSVNNNNLYHIEVNNAKNNVEMIKRVLNSMNVFYNEISYLVCRNITIYFIKSYYSFSYTDFYNKILNSFNNFSLKEDVVNKELILEVPNMYQVPLRLGEINKEEIDEIVFGIDDRNELLTLNQDNNALIIFGKEKKIISHYLDSIIIGMMHFKLNVEYEYLDCITNSILETNSEFELIDIMITRLNNRINKMLDENIKDIDEFFTKYPSETMQVIVINGLDVILNKSGFVEKIAYLMETSSRYGFYFIFSSYNNINNVNRIISQINYRIYFENSFSYDNKIIKNVSFDELNKETEGYLVYKSIMVRMSLLMLFDDEIKK